MHTFELFNVSTGEAQNMVEYSKTTGRPMAPCPEGYVRNPLTNRCKLRKRPVLVPCVPPRVRNPFTNRCREDPYKNFPWKKKAKKASPNKPRSQKAKPKKEDTKKELEKARKIALEILAQY